MANDTVTLKKQLSMGSYETGLFWDYGNGTTNVIYSNSSLNIQSDTSVNILIGQGGGVNGLSVMYSYDKSPAPVYCSSINTNNSQISFKSNGTMFTFGDFANTFFNLEVKYFSGTGYFPTIRFGPAGNGLYIQTSGGSSVAVDGNGYLYKVNSSRRYKENIQSLDDNRYNIESFKQLKPFTYQVINSEFRKPELGFIAEDLHDLSLNELVVYSNDVPDAISYDRIVVFTTKIVQEQQIQITELQTTVIRQQSQIDSLTQQLADLKSLVQSLLPTPP